MYATPDGGLSQRPRASGKPAARPQRPPIHWLTTLARRLAPLSIFDVIESAHDESTAEDIIIHVRWPQGPVCPWAETGLCLGGQVRELPNRRPRKFLCRGCGGIFNVRTEVAKTALHGSHLSFLTWILAIYFKAGTPGLKICQLGKYLGVSKRTAQRVYHILPGPLRKWNSKPLPLPLPLPPKGTGQPNGINPDAGPPGEAPKARPVKNGSVMDMMLQFRTEGDCEQRLINIMHPDGMKCPTENCDGYPVRELATDKGARKFRCRGCGRPFTVRTNTVMHASKLSSRVWIWAAYFMVNTSLGISASRLARYLGIRRATAHHLTHRLREGMEEIAPPLMTGVVEIDETIWAFKGFSARLYTVVLRSRKPDKVYVVTVLARSRAQLFTIINCFVDKGAIIFTDGWRGYWGLQNLYYLHVWVIHKDREFAKKVEGYLDGLVAHVNSVESFNGKERRAARDVYKRRYSPQHMPLYHQQDAWLHNHRHLPVMDRMKKALSQTSGRRLTLENLRQARPRLEELLSMHQLGGENALVMLDRNASWMLNGLQPLLIPIDLLPAPDQSSKRPKRRRKARPRPGNPTMRLPGF